MPALCLGIDPAPKKKAIAFQCEAGQRSISGPHAMAPQQLREHLQKTAASPSEMVMLTWDAPLTGPSDPMGRDGSVWASDFSMRPIEKALNAMKPPKWVSIRPYSGCPHWAITHNMLGLPILGPFDENENLPFRLLTQDEVPSKGRWIAEVHPAVAMWIWTGWDDLATARLLDFKYKGKTAEARTKRNQLWKRLTATWESQALRLPADLAEAAGGESVILQSDDNLDAFIAVTLALLFVEKTPGAGKRAVQLFGDHNAGAMLLPAHPTLERALDPKEMMSTRRVAKRKWQNLCSPTPREISIQQ